MIDVPVEVKDALRDGRLKKNYRVVVLWQYTDVYEIYSSHESFTATITATYLLYNKTMAHAFRYVEVMPASGGDTYSINCPDDPDKTWLEFPLNAGDSIYVANDVDDYVTLAVSDKNSTTEDFTIDNNNLVSESMSIDERMCSGDKIKFGLCEGSSMEFQYFGFPSIQGKRLQVFCDVDYGAENPYTIPMGFFDVKKCSRQASTGIIKATCYNKLQSDYLDAKANDLIEDIQSDTSDPEKVTLTTIQTLLLNDYEINQKEVTTLVGGVGTTGTSLYSSPTFKFVGSSTTYYPTVEAQLLTFSGLDPNKRYKLSCESYLSKLVQCINSFKSAVTDNVQNPDTFWTNFLNSNPYQHFGISVIYGNGDSINGFFYIDAEQPTTISPVIINHGTIEKLEYLYGVSGIYFLFPIKVEGSTSSSSFANTQTLWETNERISLSDMTVGEMSIDDIESIEITKTDLTDVTLRDLVSANYELHCTFGQLSRLTDLFSGVELNHSRLYPQETLYPDNALYPDGAQASATKSMYSKLWADEGNVHKWRNLIITYKGLDDQQQEQDFVYTAEINSDGTDDYVCSDNWLLRNLVWTQAQIEEYADTMISKMQDMTWFPFEMWCAGLPYLETGDEIEIPMDQSTYTSYVLQRQLKGIQNLQDTYINGTLDIF